MGIHASQDERADEAARQTVLGIYGLVRKLQIPPLRKIGIDRKDLERLATVTYQKAYSPENPRELKESDFLDLFTKAFDEEDPV